MIDRETRIVKYLSLGYTVEYRYPKSKHSRWDAVELAGTYPRDVRIFKTRERAERYVQTHEHTKESR